MTVTGSVIIIIIMLPSFNVSLIIEVSVIIMLPSFNVSLLTIEVFHINIIDGRYMIRKKTCINSSLDRIWNPHSFIPQVERMQIWLSFWQMWLKLEYISLSFLRTNTGP